MYPNYWSMNSCYYPKILYYYYLPNSSYSAEQEQKQFHPLQQETQVKKQRIQLQKQVQRSQNNLIYVKQLCLKNAKKQKQKKEKEEKGYSSRQQKQGRNIPSNLLKMFLNYLYKHSELTMIHEICEKLDLSMTQQQFYQKLSKHFKPKLCYISPILVRQLCLGLDGQQDFCLVFRIILKQFLKLNMISALVCSKKSQKRFRSKQMKHTRKLYKKIFLK